LKIFLGTTPGKAKHGEKEGKWKDMKGEHGRGEKGNEIKYLRTLSFLTRSTPQ
jgi:hypothetical protein